MFVQQEVIQSAINIGVLFLAFWIVNFITKYSVRKALHIFSGPVLYFSLRNVVFTLESAITAALVPLAASLLFYSAQQLNIKPLLQLIKRASSSQVHGVIVYGILWAIWPISKVYNLEDYVLPGLICLTLGDGFAGFGENFNQGKQGKSYIGSLFFIISSALGLYWIGYNEKTCIILSIVGSIVEFNVSGDNDNVMIVLTVNIAQFLIKTLM